MFCKIFFRKLWLCPAQNILPHAGINDEVKIEESCCRPFHLPLFSLHTISIPYAALYHLKADIQLAWCLYMSVQKRVWYCRVFSYRSCPLFSTVCLKFDKNADHQFVLAVMFWLSYHKHWCVQSFIPRPVWKIGEKGLVSTLCTYAKFSIILEIPDNSVYLHVSWRTSIWQLWSEATALKLKHLWSIFPGGNLAAYGFYYVIISYSLHL